MGVLEKKEVMKLTMMGVIVIVTIHNASKRKVHVSKNVTAWLAGFQLANVCTWTVKSVSVVFVHIVRMRIKNHLHVIMEACFIAKRNGKITMLVSKSIR